MGLFDFFKSKSLDGKFVSESEYKKNHQSQMKMTPQTMDQLRKAGVSVDKELKLEFFFYTNSIIKATKLSEELKNLNYQSDLKLAVGSKAEYLVNGWTTKMKMNDEIVVAWTNQMCEIGYEHDCEFDGWGTKLDQDAN